MISAKIKTKYCEISFHEDHNEGKPFYWACVSMAWAERDPSLAKAFGVLMDDKLQSETRILLKEAVEQVDKDIYLEDADLMVNIKADEKHQAIKLLGLVERLETEFNNLAAEGNNPTCIRS